MRIGVILNNTVDGCVPRLCSQCRIEVRYTVLLNYYHGKQNGRCVRSRDESPWFCLRRVQHMRAQ